MRYFFFPEAVFVAGESLELTADLRRHVEKVLRLGPGDKIGLFDGRGAVAIAVLAGSACVDIAEVVAAPPVKCHLTLIQGMPKGEKLELILQKGTELGINRFVLVPMQRSVGSADGGRLQKKIQRWTKIIQEAARQCQQFHLPELCVCDSFSEALERYEADLKLLPWEESSAPLDKVLPSKELSSVVVAIGPEGGIDAREAQAAQERGYLGVSLGPRILRTETAGIAIASVLQYRYGDLISGSQ